MDGVLQLDFYWSHKENVSVLVVLSRDNDKRFSIRGKFWETFAKLAKIKILKKHIPGQKHVQVDRSSATHRDVIITFAVKVHFQIRDQLWIP